MLSRRDCLVALVSAVITAGVLMAGGVPRSAQADETVMGSTAFDWNSFEAKPSKVGFTRQVVQRPTATLDELECHITTLNPGASPHAPHKHPDEEIIIVKEGTVESLVNGKTHRVGPGSVIFQAANQEHAIRNIGATPATYHVIKWNSPGMLKQRAAQTSGTTPQE